MTAPDPSAQAAAAIERCAALTAAMLEAVTDEDWERMNELDRDRRDSVAGVRLDLLAPTELEPLRARYRELLDMDDRLRSAAAQSRTRALSALRSARGQAKATSAYRAQSDRF